MIKDDELKEEIAEANIDLNFAKDYRILSVMDNAMYELSGKNKSYKSLWWIKD